MLKNRSTLFIEVNQLQQMLLKTDSCQHYKTNKTQSTLFISIIVQIFSYL